MDVRLLFLRAVREAKKGLVAFETFMNSLSGKERRVLEDKYGMKAHPIIPESHLPNEKFRYNGQQREG